MRSGCGPLAERALQTGQRSVELAALHGRQRCLYGLGDGVWFGSRWRCWRGGGSRRWRRRGRGATEVAAAGVRRVAAGVGFATAGGAVGCRGAGTTGSGPASARERASARPRAERRALASPPWLRTAGSLAPETRPSDGSARSPPPRLRRPTRPRLQPRWRSCSISSPSTVPEPAAALPTPRAQEWPLRSRPQPARPTTLAPPPATSGVEPLPALAAGRTPERDSLRPPIDTRPDSRSRLSRARSDFRSAAC